MVDVALISGAISALKGASEMASALVDIRDHALMQSKVIELQRVILEAQSSALAAQGQHYALQDSVRSLRQQLEDASAWSAIASRYYLREFGYQSFAYQLKAEFEGEEPRHILCSHCFSKQVKSVLMFSHGHDGVSYFDCHVCDKRRSLNGRLD